MTTEVKRDLEVYQKGTRCWFRDEREGWIGGILTAREIDNQKQNAKLTFTDENGETQVVEVPFTFDKDAPDILPPLRNPPMLEGIDDLTNLSYLHEPAVLHNIRTRYAQHNIYTYSGIVLIALNPFERISLYSHDVVQAYSGKKRGDLEPHLFAIAEDAYRCMVTENRNQTIVVSGESGSGKTVSAKYIMRYFATADDAADGDLHGFGASSGSEKRKKKAKKGKTLSRKASNLTLPESNALNQQLQAAGGGAKGESGISETEEQILATNPIMEAFGNAKTTRNDNSSRFGKYIEIEFDEDQNIVGAKIRTYLLERSRLVYQPETERNYHIFYQLVAGAPPSEKKELGLGSTFNEFHYLNQGGQGFIAGVDDAAEFEITQRALSTIGIAVKLQWQIFRVLAALLHIGNIQISGNDKTDASISESDTACNHAARLLGVSGSEMRKWIVKKQIVTRSEKIVTALKAPAASTVRDAVAKYVYSNIFDWLVRIVNSSLSLEASGVDDVVKNFIGVLDIYGFEHFKKNSFEQFCINYANEKLQQEFAEHVFKLEQELYVKEQIAWTFIDFSDNTPTIEMIEGKLGILSLLDEESRLPSGSDQGYVNKLFQQFGTPNHKAIFSKPRFSQSAFTLHHYATDVTYESEGFIDKNKDSVPDEMLGVLQASEDGFLKVVLKKEEPPAPVAAATTARAVVRKTTLGSVFKASLISLMDTINSTNVHYIRCIKPNEAKEPWGFDSPMVLNQLRACGVLETIRISCAGYPSRWSFAEFVDRYYMLVSSKQWTTDPKVFCQTILETAINVKDKYQIGLSKIFFRAGQLAFLERKRSETLNQYATCIQKYVRRMLAQKYYQKLRRATIMAQTIIRRKIAERTLQKLRYAKAAVVLQRHWRGYSARKAYQKKRRLIIKVQAIARGRAARKRFANIRQEYAAIQIQKIYRGWRCRSQYQKYRRTVIFAQSCLRRRHAKKELAQLRLEARSASHLKEVSYKLENKVFELTLNLQRQQNENKDITAKMQQLEKALQQAQEKAEKHKNKSREAEEKLAAGSAGLRKELDAALAEQKQLSSKVHTLSEQISSKDYEISNLTQELQKRKEEVTRLRLGRKNSMVSATPSTSSNASWTGGDDPATVAALRREVSNLNEQLAAAMALKKVTIGNPIITPELQMPVQAQFQTPTQTDENANKYLVREVPMRPSENSYAGLPSNTSSLGGHRRRHSSVEQFKKVAQEGGVIKPLQAFKAPDEFLVNSKRNTISLSGGISLANAFSPQAAMGMVPRLIEQRGAAPNQGILPGVPPTIVTDFTGDNPEARHALIKMLENTALVDEIVEMLIRTLTLPLPSLQNRMPRREILFPAHLIGLCTVQMWKYRLTTQMQNLMLNVMKMIQKQTALKSSDDYVCTFWLSNVHELLAIIRTTESGMEKARPTSPYTRRGSDQSETERLVIKVTNDLEFLLLGIYHEWLKDLKQRLVKMVIPGIVESQALPGFTANEGGFFNKIMGQGQPTMTVEGFLNFFTKIWKTMKCFYVDEKIMRQVIMEMLLLTGVTAFNHILMRKNFCSWKRGIQIQYNLTRIEEWCKAHDISEGTIHLERLMQAVKLLQLQKTTVQDIDTMFDVCHLLNPSQIKKLITIYAVSDYENPISPEILKNVATRSSASAGSDTLLLDIKSVTEAGNWEHPETKEIEIIERYVPSWIAGLVPNTNAVVTWSARN